MTIVAAIQMASTKDVQTNVDLACLLIEQAAHKGAHLAVLPETFATLGLTTAQTFDYAETFQNGPIQQQLAHAAKKNKIWLIGGTLPLISENPKKLYASCLVWNSNGELVAQYNKIHLFDVLIEGKEEYRESDNITSGDKIVVVDTPLGKIGLAICYDLRFPELFRAMMLKGAQIMVLPSAFTVPTGKAHWEILLRARAIENLCYMIAPGEVGIRADGRETYGHSMIIAPWGDILASAKDQSEVIVATIDLAKMQQIRQQFPVLNHYRKKVMQDLSNEENA